MKFFDSTVPKFLLVGVINTLVGSAVMFIFYNACGFSYWISSACNYIAGGICSYFLNKFFTFKNSSRSFVQIVIFILNLAVCYFIAYFLAEKAVHMILSSQSVKIRDNVAMICGMGLYTVLNYFGQRFIVFKDKKNKGGEASDEKQN